MRKIIPYLILNFFVSALAVLLVLLVWNWTHKTPQVSPLNNIQIPESPTQVTDSTQSIPLDQDTLEIQAVVGAGDVNYEQVQLISIAKLPIDLRGWKLVDSEKNEFVFPLMTIFPGGGVNVYSKGGVNTSIELYWGSNKSIWTSGEQVSLLDASGHLRATYRIP